jgi:hypothetical protein
LRCRDPERWEESAAVDLGSLWSVAALPDGTMRTQCICGILLRRGLALGCPERKHGWGFMVV